MIGIIGNHQDTGFGTHLPKIVSNTRNLHRGCLRRFQLGTAQREFDTTGEHLHGTDLKGGLAGIHQDDLSRLFLLPAKIGEIDIGGRDLQLRSQCLAHVVIILEVGKKDC